MNLHVHELPTDASISIYLSFSKFYKANMIRNIITV